MKKIGKILSTVLIVLLALCLFVLGGCGAKQTKTSKQNSTGSNTSNITGSIGSNVAARTEVPTAKPTENPAASFDNTGANIVELAEIFSGYGTLKWDRSKEGYVLYLEDIGYNNVLKSVKYLMDNPTWSYGKKWWESFKEGLKQTTAAYNCCVYVADPNSTSSSILKVLSGEVIFDYV